MKCRGWNIPYWLKFRGWNLLHRLFFTQMFLHTIGAFWIKEMASSKRQFWSWCINPDYLWRYLFTPLPHHFVVYLLVHPILFSITTLKHLKYIYVDYEYSPAPHPAKRNNIYRTNKRVSWLSEKLYNSPNNEALWHFVYMFLVPLSMAFQVSILLIVQDWMLTKTQFPWTLVKDRNSKEARG